MEGNAKMYLFYFIFYKVIHILFSTLFRFILSLLDSYPVNVCKTLNFVYLCCVNWCVLIYGYR